MELHDHPIQGQKNKFVVTEEGAYFLPVVSDEDVASFADILAEVFDVDDPEVAKTLDKMFDSGTLILGYLEADGRLDVHIPPEQNEYVEKRLQEVLGG